MKALTLGTLVFLGLACSRPAPSGDRSTNIPHSSIKRQSIGNCWTYGFIGMIEAHEMAAGHVSEFSNYSESYISFRHFESQLLDRYARSNTLQTGGGWQVAVSIVKRYGLLREGDFIPDEASQNMSKRQDEAVKYLEKSMKEGKLSQSRDEATVRAEVDAAFKVRRADFEPKIIPLNKITVRGLEGMNVPLATMLDQWSEASWSEFRYPERGDTPEDNVLFYPEPWELPESNQETLASVKRALNAGHAVILSWLVEFNATDGGTFTIDKLSNPKYERHNGLHLTSLEDYVATGFDPDTGLEFYVGEGQVTPQEQRLAADHGFVRYLITKNSWGSGFERFDRSFYLRDGDAGYNRLDMNYLSAWLWLDEGKPEEDRKSLRLGITGFQLPRAFAN